MKPFIVMWAAVCLGVVAACGSTSTSGIPNFHQVNNQVYRGGQPTSQGFRSLASMGIKTVIDLREVGEHSQSAEEAMVVSDGMRYVSVPLAGMSAPSNAQVQKILAIMNDSSAGPVFIHCRRGADRTGTIIACYRISHDHWANRKALSEARGLGMSFFEWAMQGYVAHYRIPSLPVLASGESAAPATAAAVAAH